MLSPWLKLAEKWMDVHASNELHRHRGQFLAMALGFATLATLFLTLFNIRNWLATNSDINRIYILSDLVALSICAIIFILNRHGHTRWAAVGFIAVTILYPFFFPFQPVDLTLLVYSIPIILAGFTLGPPSALVCVLIAIVSFAVLWQSSNPTNPLTILHLIILFFFGIITRLMADRWERTLILAEEFQTKYQVLVDELPGVTYLREPGEQGRWLYCSPQVETHLGISQDAWLKHPAGWNEHIHPEDRARVLDEWKRCSETLAPFHIEYRLQARKQDLLWVREDAIVIRVQGQPPRYQGMMLDITDRKRAEEKLQHEIQELAGLTRMSREISEFTDLSAVLASIARQVTEMGQADAGGVYGIGEDERLRILATYGIGDRYIREVNAQGIAPGLGVIGRAVIERRPVAVSNVFDDPGYQLAYFSRIENIHGVLAAPMLRNDQVTGVIVLWHRQPHEFSEHEIHLIQAVAQQCVNAVENARLLEAERAQRALAEALRDTANAFISTTSPDELLDSILENLKRVIPYDSANVMLLDGNSVRIARHRGYAELDKLDTVLNASSQITHLTGPLRMLETRQPIIVPDTRNDPIWQTSPTNEWIASYAGVPIRLQDQVIGFINIDSATPNFFSSQLVSRFQIFADQAALAIENARLLAETEQRATEFAALHETTNDLAEMQDLPVLLETIAQRAVNLLDTSNGAIYLYDADRQELELCVQTAPLMIPLGTRLKPGEGLAGRVAQTRQPFLVDDYQTWEHRSPKFDGMAINAVLEVPMLYRGELIGVLVVHHINDVTRKFNEAQARLLSLFASQAASAVHNARQIEETRRRAERLGALNRIARRINETLNVDTMLDMVYHELVTIMYTDSVCIALHDEPAGELDFRIRSDRNIHESPIRQPVTAGLSGLVATRRQPVLIRDYEQEKNSLPPSLIWGTGELPHSWLGVPMLADDKLVGIINVQTYNPNFSYTEADQELFSTIANTVALAINQARLFQEQRRRATQLEILNNAAIHTQQYLEPGKIFQVASDYIRAFGEFSHVFLLNGDDTLRHYHTSMSPNVLKKFMDTFHAAQLQPTLPISVIPEEWAQLREGVTVCSPDIVPRVIAHWNGIEKQMAEWFRTEAPQGIGLIAPLRHNNQTIGAVAIIGERLQVSDIPAFALFARQVSVSLDNARLFEELRHHAQHQDALHNISMQMAQLNSRTELCHAVTRALRDLLGYSYATIFLLDEKTGDRVLESYCGWHIAAGAERMHPGEGLSEKALRTGTLQYYPNIKLETQYVHGLPQAHSEIDVPLLISGKAVGVLTIEDERVDAFGNEEFEIIQVVANQLGVALEKVQLIQGLEQELVERKRAENQIQHQVDQLAALHSIDTAISASLDLNVTLEIILDQVTNQLHVDAADILRLNSYLQTLEYAAGRGFHSRAIQHTRLPLGKAHAGRAAYERRMVYIPDLGETTGPLQKALHQHSEIFVSYFAFPLIAKGEIKGVLELFHRSRLEPDQAWIDFAETLAAQTAIAMDNMALFDRLQKTNSDLILAYDTTLEGWSRTMELRDMETQGHALRVAELTIRLSRALGVGESDLPNIRHGALLHDIGKMGIPDSILMKPGPLNEEEWAIMRNHPVYAYQLLSRIPYLRSAIDIPYAHHEHWDGKGYPRGLRGEEIPFSARIFAVIDIWDALRSERPYHSAWSDDQVLEHIRKLSGTQLDPGVVAEFLRLDLRV